MSPPHDIKNGVKYQVFRWESVSSLKFLDVATLICCMNCSAHSFHAHLLPSRWPESMSLPLVLQLFLQHFKSFLNPTVHWWGSHNLLSWTSGVFMWEMTRSKSKCQVLTLSHILHLYSRNSRLIFFALFYVTPLAVSQLKESCIYVADLNYNLFLNSKESE